MLGIPSTRGMSDGDYLVAQGVEYGIVKPMEKVLNEVADAEALLGEGLKILHAGQKTYVLAQIDSVMYWLTQMKEKIESNDS